MTRTTFMGRMGFTMGTEEINCERKELIVNELCKKAQRWNYLRVHSAFAIGNKWRFRPLRGSGPTIGHVIDEEIKNVMLLTSKFDFYTDYTEQIIKDSEKWNFACRHLGQSKTLNMSGSSHSDWQMGQIYYGRGDTVDEAMEDYMEKERRGLL